MDRILKIHKRICKLVELERIVTAKSDKEINLDVYMIPMRLIHHRDELRGIAYGMFECSSNLSFYELSKSLWNR